jgi:hypothetical protein
LQRQTLFRRSLEASGKSIGNAKSILGTSSLSVYWPDDGDFYDAVPIDEDDALSLELLTSHFEFTLPGIYCPLLYEDGEMHLTPISYIFKRGDQKRLFSNYVDGDSDEDKDQKSVSSSFPTEESINTMSTLLLDISLQTLSFGEHFSDIASQLEHTSYLLHAAFEKKNKDDQRNNKRMEQFEEPKNSIISPSTTTTTTASNSTSESGENCSNSSDDEAETTTTTTTNSTENKSYINYDWIDLPEHIKNAAQRIGYNKQIWDSTDGDLPIDEKEWKDLTEIEQEDLKIIGYNETSWDSEDDDDSDY